MQFFGEVAASSTTPCTDMGTGAAASTTSGLLVSAPTTSAGPARLALSATDGALYGIVATGRGVRLGGAGAC